MGFQNRYSYCDRILHRLGASSRLAQMALADIEGRLFKSQIGNIVVSDPVFITGLPRAGTTVLLGALVQSGHFASHCYRDMPFVLTPILWHQLSSAFRTTDEPRERAHGDGGLLPKS